MREYHKVTKTYTTEEISKCVCDKCGKECEKIEHDIKRTYIEINPKYAEGEHIILDLCSKCTRELLEWFPKNENIEDFKETLDIWEREDL